MRICIFARAMHRHRPHYIPPPGLLARVFAGLGHEVTVLTQALPDGGGGIFRDEDAQVHYLSGGGPGRRIATYWKRSAERFDELQAEQGFDVLLGRGHTVSGYFQYSRFAGQVPVITHEGTYPLWLHQIETRSRPLAALLAPVLALLLAGHQRQARACRQRAARMVCNSPMLADALTRISWWHPPRGVFIPYGFDASAFDAARVAAAANLDPNAPPRLVYVGRLTGDKGVFQMIDILAQLARQDTVLEAIGPVYPKLRAALVRHALARGVADRFLMPGPVHNTELPERLAGAAAFVFPSTHPEGLSKSLMEAMAAGLPVVAYRLPGQDTLVNHGVTGWLEPPRALGQLVRRIDDLLADPAAAAAMGAAARRKIGEDFAPERIAAQWQALLTAVVDEHARSPAGAA